MKPWIFEVIVGIGWQRRLAGAKRIEVVRERLEFGGAHVRRVRESFHVGNGLVDERLRDPETIEK
jgi:hypothetical protein